MIEAFVRVGKWLVIPILIIVAFIEVLGYFSLRPNNSPQEQCDTQQWAKNDPNSQWPSRIACWGSAGINAVSTHKDFFGIGAALIAAIFTGGLFWQANDTSERELRAYVFVDGMELKNVTNPIPAPGNVSLPVRPSHGYGAELIYPNQGPFSSFLIRNYGATPAYKVVHWAHIDIREYPLVSPLLIPKKLKDLQSTPIPPNGVMTKSVRYPDPLTPVQLNGLRNKTHAIYIWGRITYLDTFKRRRFTDYRLFHNAEVGYIGINSEMRTHPEGNDAT